MPRTVTTNDDTLQMFASTDLNSNVLTQLQAGIEIDLGDTSTFEGREWIEATTRAGIVGFVLAPSARGHTTLAHESAVLKNILLTENEVNPIIGPSGVGGWLLVPILTLLIAPLLTVYGVSLFGEVWTDSWFFTVAIGGGILSAWSLFVAMALINRWPTAPRLAQALLVSSCAISIGFAALVYISVGVDIGIARSIGSILGTLLWVRYFGDSGRVHATYGPIAPGPIKLRHANLVAITGGILVCLVTIGIADHRRQTWSEFRSDNPHYRVEGPGMARKSTIADGTPQVTFGNDTRGFVVLSSAIAQGNDDPQSYFKFVRDKVVTGMNGSVTSYSPFSRDGISGIDFRATFPGKGATGDLLGRVYMVGSTGIVLLVSGPQGGRTASDADRFFRSFRIEPR